MTSKVLENIRVIDITRYVAGPVCAAQFADLGAEVIHIENVGGGEDRSPLPVAPGFNGGAGFIQVNRNKKSLSLDLGHDSGQAILRRLLKTCDILVSNMPQQAAVSLGIDYETVKKIRPDIISVEISSFGSEGPYANRTGFDAIAQVMSGAVHLSGPPGHPTKNAAAWVDMTAGNHATIGALAALLYRNATGEGQKVEVNLLQSAMTVTNYFLLEEALTGMGRESSDNRAQSGGPADLAPTTDGAVYVAVLGQPMFSRFATLIGQPELVDDERFQSDESRAKHGDQLSGMLAAWTAGRSSAQALEQLAAARIPAGPLLKPREVLQDEHVLASGFLERIEVPGLNDPVPYVTPAYRLSKSPASIVTGPPTPGQHTDEILTELGFSPAEIAEFRQQAVV
ncbi:MAG: CoA transferase [Halieaceae bacterium]|nr:CoA transferase [Halieaceae bacterium]